MATLSDHYWIVGGDEAQLWASGRGRYVSKDDSTYADWAAAGGASTAIATEAELKAVLRAAGINVYPVAGVPTRPKTPLEIAVYYLQQPVEVREPFWNDANWLLIQDWLAVPGNIDRMQAAVIARGGEFLLETPVETEGE